MKKNPIKTETYKATPDGGFAVEIDLNAVEDVQAPPGGASIALGDKTEKNITVSIDMQPVSNGEKGETKAMSNVGVAETLVAVIRVLVDLVYATSAAYSIDIDDLMGKVRATIDHEFYSKNKKDG